MKKQTTLKLLIICGLSSLFANASQSEPCDTTRVVHVRYTPEGDYMNLERIRNGKPTEQYMQIVGSPNDELTLIGDTVIIARSRRSSHKQIFYNISNDHVINRQR